MSKAADEGGDAYKRWQYVLHGNGVFEFLEAASSQAICGNFNEVMKRVGFKHW